MVQPSVNGIEYEGQDHGPDDGNEEGRDNHVEEVEGKDDEKNDEHPCKMLPFHIIPITFAKPGTHSIPWKTLSIASESSLLRVSSILSGLDVTPSISFEISIFWLNTFLSATLPR